MKPTLHAVANYGTRVPVGSVEETSTLPAAADSRKPLWTVLLLLLVFTLLCMLQHQGQILTLAFTPLALIGGAYLLRKSRAMYLSFVVWVWCFAPLVRRVADYVSWYRQQSPVLLAPVLVSLLGMVVVWKKRGELLQSRALVFLLPAAGILFGLLLGAARNPINVTLTVGLRWMVPICFALFLYFGEDEHHTLTREFQRTVIVAATLAGAYALLQYVHPLPWDAFWLTNVSIGMVAPSFGIPEPFQIRVFGPLFAPGLLAGLLACALLMLVGQKVRVLAVAAPIITMALMLTKIRTAWMGVVLGLVYLLIKSEPQKRLRLLAIVLGAGLVIPILMSAVNPTSDVSDRMDSFVNLGQDESAQSRTGGIMEALGVIASEPLGKGLGYLDSDAYLRSSMATKYEVAAHDLGVVEVPLELGLLGAGLYLMGILYLVSRVIRIATQQHNLPVIVGLVTLCVSFLAYTPTSNALIYFDGFLFWSAAALLMHHDLQMQMEQNAAPTLYPVTGAAHGMYGT